MTVNLTKKNLLLCGILALAFVAFNTVLFIANDTLSDVKKEVASLKREVAGKAGKREINDLLKKQGIEDQLPELDPVLFTEPYEKVIVDYFAAKNWQDRVPLVLNPKTAGPKMERHYFFEKDGFDLEAVAIYSVDRKSKVSVGEYIRLLVRYQDNQSGGVNSNLYYVKRTRDGYKIDWEASMGKNAMTWNAFVAQRPKTPMSFRVAARLDHYYNWSFSGKEHVYTSVLLNTQPQVYGYALKGSQSEKRIYEILKDGEYHRLILKIRFLPNDHPMSDTVLIDVIVSEDWVMRDGKEFGQ